MLILSCLFFISGFTALLYQVCWQRMLMLFVGSDAYSVTIVITTFLLGLGIGSYLGGRVADRLTMARTLAVYAALECLIGIFAFISPAFFNSFLSHWSTNFGTNYYSLFLGCSCFLLLPTTLMGMTLPCISKAVISKNDFAAQQTGSLYAINIIGAAIGSLITGWYLVGTYGYQTTVYIGGVTNVLIAIVALVIYRSRFFTQRHYAIEAIADIKDTSTSGHPVSSKWYFLFFTSGFIAISLEIIWFRVLNVLQGGGPYLFAALLFYFLLFDGLGTLYIIRKVSKIKKQYSFILILQGMIASYAIGSLYLLSIRPASDSLFFTLSLPCLLIAVPAFMIGMAFPVIQAAIQNNPDFVGRRIGYVLTANIFGNALAGILTGLVFIDFFGTSGTVVIIASIGAACILSSLFWHPVNKRLPQSLIVIFLLIMIPLFPKNTDFWRGVLTIDHNKKMFFNESASGTSALVERADEQGFTVFINGTHQGRIPPGIGHIYLGLLPGLIHPEAKDILIIGLGSGATAYSAGFTQEAETINVIEIIHGHKLFIENHAKETGYTKPMFEDARYKFIEGDGRKFLNDTEKLFDIIEADAIHPGKSGSGFLYSQEYFKEASQKLKPHGIMAQWRPTERVQKTFLSVFPYVVSFNDFVLIGSMEPIVIDQKSLLSLSSAKRVANYFSMSDTQAKQVLDDVISDKSIKYWTPDNTRENDINTDARPKDEYSINN